MDNKYLHREDAGFGKGLWDKLDETVTSAAKSRLTGRRLLPVEGPYGPGMKSIGIMDHAIAGTLSERVRLHIACLLPVPVIESSFTLSMRDIAAFESNGDAPGLKAAAGAAMLCADQEDVLVFGGDKNAALEGLLNFSGVQKNKLADWKETGRAVNNILEAVNKLDASGFHGPYALAMAPARHNLLFRRYPDGTQTELEHLRQVITGGIIKSHALASEAILVSAAKELAAIVIGQDLTTSLVGPSGRDYEFVVFESAALRLSEPASVCVMQ
ncbi:MAG: family 1 encapsulin nanocompartment shell protein [Kiritimatiellia bacterium]